MYPTKTYQLELSEEEFAMLQAVAWFGDFRIAHERMVTDTKADSTFDRFVANHLRCKLRYMIPLDKSQEGG